MGLIEKFGAKYGFNDRQRQISEKLIDRYFENRQRVLEIRRRFPNDHELIKKLTGVKLDGNENVSVSVGPMTIDISADDFNVRRLYEKIDKPIVNFQYGGFASESVGKNPVYYIVVNQDASVRELFNDPVGEKTRGHEYEHQKNKLFRAVFKYQKAPQFPYGYLYDHRYLQGRPPPEIKKAILQDFFDANRTVALENAKDEIIAWLSEGDTPTFQGQLEELFFSGKVHHYDYLDHLRNWKEFKDDPLYQETAQRMLVQEYRTIIQKAVDSYAKLIQKGGYSAQKAIALLTDKSLKDWPKTIKRLLEQREP